jgi:protein involved in polysaccharide export with SLBB domain
LVLALLGGIGQLRAQSGDDRPLTMSRAQLEEALTEAEQMANSDVYSAAVRDQKRQEASLIRTRLQDGDLLVGDAINLTVSGDSGFTGVKQVAPGRILQLPGVPDISLRGILRSELEPYLTQEIGRYLRDPQVRARPLIRITVVGGVTKPGFYQFDADLLLSDALTQAGGIGTNTKLKNSAILRDKQEIVGQDLFQRAIKDGLTLDQLNLRAGDEINVGERSTGNWYTTLSTIAIIPGLILGTYGIGKLVGAF